MPINFVPMAPLDTEDLMGFQTSNHFPFHVQPDPQISEIGSKVQNGYFLE